MSVSSWVIADAHRLSETELLSETESFKVKYFRCFVWNWVENSRAWSVISIFHALLHHFVWAHLQIWPCFSAGGISTESMCFWGGSGRIWLTELLLMRLEKPLCLKEALMCPAESISPEKPDLILEESKKKVLECFWYLISFNSFVITLFCILASGVSSGAEAVCTRKMAFCLRGWSQEHCVKPQHFSCFMKPDAMD